MAADVLPPLKSQAPSPKLALLHSILREGIFHYKPSATHSQEIHLCEGNLDIRHKKLFSACLRSATLISPPPAHHKLSTYSPPISEKYHVSLEGSHLKAGNPGKSFSSASPYHQWLHSGCFILALFFFFFYSSFPLTVVQTTTTCWWTTMTFKTFSDSVLFSLVKHPPPRPVSCYFHHRCCLRT